MPTLATTRQLASAQAQFRRDAVVLFRDVAARISGTLLAYTNADGVIPPAQEQRVRGDVGALVSDLFTARSSSSVYSDGRAPFAADGTTPLASYPRLLNEALARGIAGVVAQHYKQIQTAAPPSVWRWLQQARPPQVREQVNVGDWGRAVARYNAPHTWVDPAGYRLSDRIWNTSTATRNRIDRMVTEAIRTGRPSTDLARELEQFLIPGRARIRTRRPYGQDASFDAMRLARTEIGRAYADMQRAAATANPYVTGMDWALSASHPRIDICDDLATIGMSGERIRDPYPVDEAPIPIESSHPQCVTPGQLIQTKRGTIPIENIRVNDLVLTHEGRYRRVLSVWHQKHSGVVYQITTPLGKLEVTGNHPLYLSGQWVDAALAKVGDNLLYASGGILGNSFVSDTNHAPSLLGNEFITDAILFNGLRFIVTFPIALNDDLSAGQSEVNEIISELTLPFKRDIGNAQGGGHLALIGREIPLEHGNKAGIINALDSGDFLRDFRAFGGVVVAAKIPPLHSQYQTSSRGFAAGAIIIIPMDSDSLTDRAHLDIAEPEQVTQRPVGYPQAASDFWRAKLLLNIQFIQDFLSGALELGFKPQCVILDGGQIVRIDVTPIDALHQFTTNGAVVLHDNLLSLSPDMEWGAGSGLPVVNGLARPIQALRNYTTITDIKEVPYVGNVYNMTVEEDSSYTVNGACVHNCICDVRPYTGPIGDINEELRAMINDGAIAEPSPASPLLFLELLVGAWFARQVWRWWGDYVSVGSVA